ncbi:Pentatricopeptide repeat-containing protein [Acorus calamus]|uniref:Pentatricopeptide repeat-containing protein n=1 Tax=Acorus calamus TaxID=4465 RepID=A0AAV9E6B6_ACOCL|nr:Pentatricopeptide repeat-containing protein [Acorus calamus]
MTPTTLSLRRAAAAAVIASRRVIYRSLCTIHAGGDDTHTPKPSPSIEHPKRSDLDRTHVDDPPKDVPLNAYSEIFGSSDAFPSMGTLCDSIPIDEDPMESIPRERFLKSLRSDADKMFDVLHQDCPGFNVRQSLDELRVRVTAALVREVLQRILRSSPALNKPRLAKLAYKFFSWCASNSGYTHTSDAYNLLIKIFAESDEFSAMCRLADEMAENGLSTTAYTFILLVCSCGSAGMARRVVERFLQSKSFSYRPFKHSYNAILHSLLTVDHYRLIEWVYRRMVSDGYAPDVLTYNIVMSAKYRLGKLDEFHALLDEMGRNGFAPDLHTYNLLLHVLGKGDKPLAAFNLMNYMREVGCEPSVLHFTNLIDGLGRAGNLEACEYFFEEMVKSGCEADVVCYTAMIAGCVAAGEVGRAGELFEEMVTKGQLPNVFTYNLMISGLCVAGRFDEACKILEEMEARGRKPNFLVYSNLVGRLQSAGRNSQAREVLSGMLEKGRYVHLVSKFRRSWKT